MATPTNCENILILSFPALKAPKSDGWRLVSLRQIFYTIHFLNDLPYFIIVSHLGIIQTFGVIYCSLNKLLTYLVSP